jgi:uncharacterized protein YceK
MMKKLMLILMILSLGGCASAVGRHEQLQAHLTSPVDCINAESDIVSLQKEKASSGEKFLNGLASLLPSSALLNIVTGEFSSRVSIASGKFNKSVETRIQDIHDSCDGALVASN